MSEPSAISSQPSAKTEPDKTQILEPEETDELPPHRHGGKADPWHALDDFDE